MLEIHWSRPQDRLRAKGFGILAKSASRVSRAQEVQAIPNEKQSWMGLAWQMLERDTTKVQQVLFQSSEHRDPSRQWHWHGRHGMANLLAYLIVL